MRTKTLRKLSIMLIISLCCLYLFGCTAKNSFHKNVVLTVNDVEISLEQAKFYAYNKQANYEVYYLVSGQEINWDSPYGDTDVNDITMEILVKQEVLEQIKELVLVSEHAKDEGITLTNDDKNNINALVEEFKTGSKDILLAKTGKDQTVLTTIFTRQKYVDKLYEKLEITDDADAQDELFAKLLSNASTTLNDDLWNSITFDEAIYTPEDVEPMSE